MRRRKWFHNAIFSVRMDESEMEGIEEKPTLRPMWKPFLTLSFMLLISLFAWSQKKLSFKGMYLQWGYNKEWYTKSQLHFRMSNGDRFTIHNAVAHDKPDYDAIYKSPGDISIPQYNYRIGFYLNLQQTKAVELNFDHAKYVVKDFQKVRVTGTIDGIAVDGDSILNPASFLHLEHTDGANWLHLNYVQQWSLLLSTNKKRNLLTLIGKGGAGINIPRTDFTWRGDRHNNDFHVAGYNISVEGGIRFYPSKRWFIEGTGKTGYVRYINALADTKYYSGNRIHHGFGYFEIIATVGYDIPFKK